MDAHDIYGIKNIVVLEENALKYKLGGYHPVALGDVFKDRRYRICHKLGFGGLSTVWLARDSLLERWVSLKIMTADETKQSRELTSLRVISAYPHENIGSKYIVTLFDDFIHHGPNGSHQCFVFELLGPTVNTKMECYVPDGSLPDERSFYSDEILMMAKQLLQAVAFLHEAGYAHGDLSIRNIVFNMRGLSSLPEDELMQFLGPPELEELVRLDGAPLEQGVPTYLVESARWDGWPGDLNEDCDSDEDLPDDIRLIDLGEAFPHDVVPEILAQPSGLQAPETVLVGKFDYRVDLWRCGLIIFYLVFGHFPFMYFYTEHLIDSMIHFCGDNFPQEWVPLWEKLILQGRGDTSMLSNAAHTPVEKSSLFRRFKEDIHQAELKVLLPVIQGLTRFLPTDRITASQALAMIEEAGSNGSDTETSTEGSDDSRDMKISTESSNHSFNTEISTQGSDGIAASQAQALDMAEEKASNGCNFEMSTGGSDRVFTSQAQALGIEENGSTGSNIKMSTEELDHSCDNKIGTESSNNSFKTEISTQRSGGIAVPQAQAQALDMMEENASHGYNVEMSTGGPRPIIESQAQKLDAIEANSANGREIEIRTEGSDRMATSQTLENCSNSCGNEISTETSDQITASQAQRLDMIEEKDSNSCNIGMDLHEIGNDGYNIEMSTKESGGVATSQALNAIEEKDSNCNIQAGTAGADQIATSQALNKIEEKGSDGREIDMCTGGSNQNAASQAVDIIEENVSNECNVGLSTEGRDSIYKRIRLV